ncbi:MAG TPA: ESX secretion-associated protein EspG [Pseudonocardiaceae bacterium]|nr:ESX secretion-associated protein EspG [Pseudonocardiaceae bacterium]
MDVIGDALELDVRPFPFQFPVHGELVEDRIRLIKAAERTLTAKGLIDGARFVDDVPDLLGVFARGRLAIAMLGSVDGESFYARAVTDDRMAVLATQHGQSVQFDPVTPTSMVRAILSLLPPARPGLGRSVTITTDPPTTARPATDEDLGGKHYLQAVRPPQDSAGTQPAMIQEIMRRPRQGSGYFSVTVRGRNARESTPLTMNWLDTDSGRYVVIPTAAADGRLHVTYTPADQVRLEQSLSRLVHTLT